jgi:hypothetical protein
MPQLSHALTIALGGGFLFVGVGEVVAGGVNPAGEPWPRYTIDNDARGADGVRVADLNHDGRPDFLTAWEFTGMVRIALNPGGCGAIGDWDRGIVSWVADCEDVFAVDLDGDDRLDLVTCTEGLNRRVFVHWGPKTDDELISALGWRTEEFTAAPDWFWMYGVAAQVDGLNGPDLILGSKTDDIGVPAVVCVAYAPPDPRELDQWVVRTVATVGWVTTMSVEDMDGDGLGDIVLFDRFGPTRGVRWLRHPGLDQLHTGLLWEPIVVGQNFSATIGTVADVDGDGLRDIVTPERPTGLHWFERLDATGRKWERHSIQTPSNVGTGKAVSVGDVNLDGRPDIVMTFAEAGDGARGVVWYYNSGNPIAPFWAVYDISGPEGDKYDAAPLLDVDGDGDLDVVATDEHDNATGEGLGLVWYRNPAISFDLDLDSDGFVGFGDLSRMLDEFGQSGHGLTADVDHDGTVDFIDLNLLLGYYGLPADKVGCR